MSPKPKRAKIPKPLFQGVRVQAVSGEPEGIGTVLKPAKQTGKVLVHWDIDGPLGAPRSHAVTELAALAGAALSRDRNAARRRIAELLPVAKPKQPPLAREVRGGLSGKGKRT
jgi:hypothetical protein